MLRIDADEPLQENTWTAFTSHLLSCELPALTKTELRAREMPMSRSKRKAAMAKETMIKVGNRSFEMKRTMGDMVEWLPVVRV